MVAAAKFDRRPVNRVRDYARIPRHRPARRKPTRVASVGDSIRILANASRMPLTLGGRLRMGERRRRLHEQRL